MSRDDTFTTMRTVGGLLPPDLLARVATGTDLPGLTPADYHLAAGESVRAGANRAWQYLLGSWSAYRDALAAQPDGAPTTSLTRERWLLLVLRELGYGRVPTTPAGGLEADGKAFPVSHHWEDVPLHLLGWGTDLDTRTKALPGAAGAAPQSLVQELLNRSPDHLWAVVSNGQTWRLLRDSAALAGQAYVEFDLQAMFDGEVFADFVAFYLLNHQSRLERLDPDAPPGDCWLERWRTTAAEEGTRALDQLRSGVTNALQALGTGFLAHPANTTLRATLETGEHTNADLQRALLRLVYRLLFTFVAEDRGALLAPYTPAETAARYTDYFSTARLRRLAQRRRGSAHDDLYRALTLVLAGLGRDDGLPALGLPGLGGLFDTTALDAPLAGAHLSNRALLTSIRHLSVIQPKAGGPQRVVDYRNLGAEELGSVYESLLELTPRVDLATRTLTLDAVAGNERKTSGSYYTPTALVDLVLDTALDPLLDEATKAPDPETALLEVTVADPALGSGHFVVAAARRIAKRLAAVRTGDPEPGPEPVSQAMHDVVSHCIYGVDVNPMATELAKVSLWLEALQPGRPLSFLDAHLKTGNALLGVTPALLAGGLPDEAFVALTGDDKTWTTALRRRNKTERETTGQGELFGSAGLDPTNTRLARAFAANHGGGTAEGSASLAQVHAEAQRYAALLSDPEYARARRVADAWCAAFVQPKTKSQPALTHATLQALQDDPDSVPPDIVGLVDRLAAEYRFFHWHLEFPQLFTVGANGPTDPDPDTGWAGGLRCVLGNPPWERVKLQEQEFFASRDADIANAKNAAARKKAIDALADTNPGLLSEFHCALRRTEGESHLLRSSGRYPLTGRGDVNTYSVFAETMRQVASRVGYVGVIVPTGLLTGATTQEFAREILGKHELLRFFDFRNDGFFQGVASAQGVRFSVVGLDRSGRAARSELVFGARSIREADDPLRRVHVPADHVLLLNPNTGTLPAFRSRIDAEITLGIYRRFPVLIRDDPADNPWGLRFLRMFDMANDSGLFRTAEDLEAIGATFDGWAWATDDTRWLPLYEAKMMHLYNDRFGTYEGVKLVDGKGVRALPTPTDLELQDPTYPSHPRYWVDRGKVDAAIADSWDRGWLLGWRDITAATDFRTFVPCVLPRAAVGHVFPLVLTGDPGLAPLLQAVWSSFVFDYVSRQKLSGTHLTYGVVEQLACPSPAEFDDATPWDLEHPLSELVRDRVRELVYTSWRMAPYAQDLGDHGAPFRWLPERREQIRAEQDAMMFHLFGLARSELEHVMDSFPVVRKYEERDHGEYRTRRLILDFYDALARAADSGVPYQTPIVPPPGYGPRHDESTRPDWAKENA